MNPRRLTVKFFLQEPESVSLEPFIPVFHRWIQEKNVEGILIDVADYRHIQHGPGVVLIGDRVDYAIDLGKGRPGLLLRCKQHNPENGSLHTQAREALLLAARACQALETEPALQGLVAFRTGEVEISFQDRLAAPNTADTFAEFFPELEGVLGQLYPGHGVELSPVSEDPREAFGVHVQAPYAPGLDRLIQNLEAVMLPEDPGRAK